MFTLTNNDKCPEIFFTADEPAVAEAARAMRAIRGFASDLTPRGALVFAAQRYPDDALSVAAEKVATEFANMRAQIRLISARAEKERRAESVRLAPLSRAASNRLSAINAAIEKIVQHIDAINRRNLKLDDGKAESQAEQLRKAGVSETEVERICGKEKTVEELVLEKTALEAEAGKIKLFDKTRDPSVLPAHVIRSAVEVKAFDPIKGVIVTAAPHRHNGAE